MPPIDGPFVTPGGSAGCAPSAVIPRTSPATRINVLFIGAINLPRSRAAALPRPRPALPPPRGTMRPTHEPECPPQADSDDGAGVLRLGSVVPADLRLPPERRLLARGTDVDPE